MPLLANRYEILGVLGRGGSGSVLRARDGRDGREVALKRLERPEGAWRILFQHEYWMMRRLDHTGLVPAYESGLADGAPYFTMELVEGAPLPAPGGLGLEDVRRVLEPLCAVLDYLHGQHLVHGDLKPGNLRFDRDGRLRLLDLGFVQQAGSPGRRRGTPAYMAPEVIRGLPCDPRSDIFSLGAIAYELLAGRPPFEAEDGLALLAAQTAGRVEPLVRSRPDLDPPAAEAFMACLSADPALRPGSAGALAARLGWAPDSGSHLVFPGVMVGREADVGGLHAWLPEALAGQAGPLCVAGDAGSGKTRMLQELIAGARERGLMGFYLTAQGEVPYALVAELLAEASSVVDRADPRWQALGALAPDWGEAPPPLDPRSQEVRLRLALADLLAEIGREQGLLLAIDDWDRADAVSLRLLGPLVARQKVPGIAWAIGVREVQDGAGTEHRTLQLDPLDPGAVGRLLDLSLGQTPDEAMLERVTDIAGGNPGAIRSLLTHWHASGALRRSGGRWTLDPDRAARVPAELLGQTHGRLAALTDDALELARSGAVLGYTFSLADLPWLPDEALFAGLAELESAQVVLRSADRCHFLGGVREAILADLPPDAARRLHRLAAQRLGEARDLPGRTRAARHHIEAGSPDAATRALEAARDNLAAGSPEAAAGLLRALDAWELAPAERQERWRLHGDVQRIRGESSGALASYAGSLAIARERSDTGALCRDLVSAARSALGLSDFGATCRYVGEALPLARDLGLADQEARALMARGRAAFFGGDAAAARQDYEEALAAASRADLPSLQADALGFLGVLAEPADPRARDLLAQAVEIQRRQGNALGLCEALTNLGDRLIVAGRLPEAEAAFEEALAITSQVGARLDEGVARLNLGQVALDRGEPARALEMARRVQDLAAGGDRDYTAPYALSLEALACSALGDYPAARRAAQGAAERAGGQGNRYLLATARMAGAEVALEIGDAGAARQALEEAKEGVAPSGAESARLRLLEGRLATLEGNLRAAGDALAAGRSDACKEGLELLAARFTQALGYLEWRRGGPGAPDLAREALAAAEALGAHGLAAEASWLLGAAAQSGGIRERARDAYGSGLEVARARQLPLLAALCELGLVRVAPECDPHGDRAVEAHRVLRELEARAGTAFSCWPERSAGLAGAVGRSRRVPATAAGIAPAGAADAHDGPASAGLTGPLPASPADSERTPSAVWISGALGIVNEARRANSLTELLDRLLDRLFSLTGARGGAILAYRSGQLTAWSAAGTDAETVAAQPATIRAFWEHERTVEESRWVLPVESGEVTTAVIHVEGAPGALLTGAEVARELCQAVGQALELFREFETIALLLERLDFVEKLARLGRQASSQAGLVAGTLDALLEATHAERAFLLARDGQGGVEEIAVRTGDGARDETRVRPSRSVCLHVLASGEPVSLIDAQGAEGWQRQESILEMGLRTIAAVPLRAAGQALGVLYLDSADVLVTFGEREQGLLEAASEFLVPLVS